MIEETAPFRTPRDNEGLIAPRPLNYRCESTFQPLYACALGAAQPRFYRLSIWYAPCPRCRSAAGLRSFFACGIRLAFVGQSKQIICADLIIASKRDQRVYIKMRTSMLYLAAHAENKKKELLLNVLTAVMDAAQEAMAGKYFVHSPYRAPIAALTAGAAAALSHLERDELAQMCVEIRADVASAEEPRS